MEDLKYAALLESILNKAFGSEMNSIWSAWANKVLTKEESRALEMAGVKIKDNVHYVEQKCLACDGSGNVGWADPFNVSAYDRPCQACGGTGKR